MTLPLMRLMVIGDRAFQQYAAAKAVAVDPALEALIHMATELTNSRVKANASGRPGPNAPTGDYRRSWVTSYQKKAGTITGIAGTNKPQGRRLEYGFHGADSLGRVYNQPPYPHVGPAAEWGSQYLRDGANALGRSM